MFVAHPTLGDSVIVIHSTDRSMYSVKFAEDKDGTIRLSPASEWEQVIQEYTPVNKDEPTIGGTASEESAETYEEVASISIEESDINMEDMYSPLTLKMRLIEQGFGNPRDKHYYSKEQLVRDAHKFVGIKMYTTNHVSRETNERNEVAQIVASAYSESHNGIMAEVAVFDPMFARKVRNRAKLKLLGGLHCSIKSDGTSYTKPFTIGEQTGKLVKEFTEVHTVDFVSRAGAGGTAVEMV